MEYGFCTGFASTPLWDIQSSMLSRVMEAGFDYAELPLMSFADMEPHVFSSVLGSFKAPVACNLFPGSIPLVSHDRDFGLIDDYLDRALPRAVSLGIGRIVFGSGKARSYDPSSMSCSEALGRLAETIGRSIVPKAAEYGVTILIEPLRRGECNLVNTVQEGHDLALDVGSSNLLLMADLYHMMSNGEDVSSLASCLDLVRHIHIAGLERSLANTLENPYILEGLSLLRSCSYDGTISFETCDGDIKSALLRLKELL